MPNRDQIPESQGEAIDLEGYAQRERARSQAVEEQWEPLTKSRAKGRQVQEPLVSPISISSVQATESQAQMYSLPSAINPDHWHQPSQNSRAETFTPMPSRVAVSHSRTNPPSFPIQKQWPAQNLFDEPPSPLESSVSTSPSWPGESPVWLHGLTPPASRPIANEALFNLHESSHQTNQTNLTARSRYEPNFPRSTHPPDEIPPRKSSSNVPYNHNHRYLDRRSYGEDSEDEYEDLVEHRVADVEPRAGRRVEGPNRWNEEVRWREVASMTEKAVRLEQEANLKEAEARRKEVEARRKEEAARQKEEKTLKKEVEIRKREEEVIRREEELNRRDAETEARQQYLRQEEFRKRVEEIRRRAAERRWQDRTGSYPKSRDRAGFTTYPSTTPTTPNSPWSGQNHSGSTAKNSTGRSSTSSSRSSNTRSAWSTRPSPTSRTQAGWPPPTPTSSAKSGAGPQPPPMSGREWARRQAEQDQKRQEQFRLEQERLERDRQAKAGKILSKEEVIRLFETHRRQWAELSSSDALHWDSFPWPMLKSPLVPDELTTTAIGAYVLSPHYPQAGDVAKTSKDHIKEHIKRWHPDRFETKLLPKVVEEEREKVKHGAGLVARCLNDLLTRSNVSTSLF